MLLEVLVDETAYFLELILPSVVTRVTHNKFVDFIRVSVIARSLVEKIF